MNARIRPAARALSVPLEDPITAWAGRAASVRLVRPEVCTASYALGGKVLPFLSGAPSAHHNRVSSTCV